MTMMVVDRKPSGSLPQDEAPPTTGRDRNGLGSLVEKTSMELRKNFERSMKELHNVTPPPPPIKKEEEETPSPRTRTTAPKEVISMEEGEDCSKSVARGGVVVPFPWKLHEMLDHVDIDDFTSIVSWQPHGRSFMVHKSEEFVSKVMPIYFNQTKFASFQRQLNLYGFRRFTTGQDKGAYYHDCFLRGRKSLCANMARKKIKGTRVRRAMVPGSEPNFYDLPFMPTKSTGRTMSPNMSSTNRKTNQAFKPSNAEKKKRSLSTTSITTTTRRTTSTPAIEPVQSPKTVLVHVQHPSPPYQPPPATTLNHPYLVPSTPPLAPEQTTSSPVMTSTNWSSPPPPQPVTPDCEKPIVVVMPSTKQEQDHQEDYPSSKCGDVLFFEGKPFHYLDHGYGVHNVLNVVQQDQPPSSFMLPTQAV